MRKRPEQFDALGRFLRQRRKRPQRRKSFWYARLRRRRVAKRCLPLKRRGCSGLSLELFYVQNKS
jgi:hypothetical protein